MRSEPHSGACHITTLRTCSTACYAPMMPLPGLCFRNISLTVKSCMTVIMMSTKPSITQYTFVRRCMNSFVLKCLAILHWS